MEFGILGPLVVRREGATVEIGALKQRALLICLLLRRGQTVPIERLIDALWEEDPPPQARVTLRSYISILRRLLDTPGAEPVIVTRGNGYGLQVQPDDVDAVLFERLVANAREVAPMDPAAALALLADALSLWRGEALADVSGSTFAAGERLRLEEVRLSAEEDRFEMMLALERHREAVAGLESFRTEFPLRERAHGQLMQALYRSGRAADALSAYKQYRETLVEELGLDPSPELQQIAARILRQEDDVPHGAAAAPESKAATPVSSGAERASTRLVGRTHERVELRAAIQRLGDGTGGLLLIAGEPGIGKSTLLEELAHLAQGTEAQVLWGRSQETKGAPAFWPWIQVLRDAAADQDDAELRAVVTSSAASVTHLVGSIATRLGLPAPEMDSDLESARFQLYDGIASFLLAAAAQRPLVLLFDDLHWADAPSLETLAFLTPLLGSAPILIAAAYRDVRADWAENVQATLATVVREPWTQQIGLVGLQPEAVAALAEQLSGERLTEDQREQLHQRTDGNPFFVRQLAHLMVETGSRTGGDHAIPSAVTHVIARRLGLLPVEVRSLLETASVVGAQFDVRWVATMTTTGVDAALEAAAVAAEHGLIEAVGRSPTNHRFVHALVRETIYDSLAPLRLARTHAQVGTALESTPNTPAGVLAEHFWRAADVVDDDRPVTYLLAAADEALKMFAHEQAEIYLRRALELLMGREADTAVEMQVRGRLVELLVAAKGWSAPEVEEVAEPARRLARRAGSRPDVIPLWSAMFVQYLSRGDAPVAREMTQQLLEESDEWGHPSAIAASRIAASQLELSQGGNANVALEYARHAERYAEIAQEQGLEGRPEYLRVAAAYMVACALALGGQADEGIEAARRAISLAQEGEAPFSLAVACMVGSWVGMHVEDPAFTLEAGESARRLAEHHGLAPLAAMGRIAEGWARARLGADPAEQAHQMREAVDTITATGHVADQARRLLFTAETYALAHDDVNAKLCVGEALVLAAKAGERLPVDLLGRVQAAVDACGVQGTPA